MRPLGLLTCPAVNAITGNTRIFLEIYFKDIRLKVIFNKLQVVVCWQK